MPHLIRHFLQRQKIVPKQRLPNNSEFLCQKFLKLHYSVYKYGQRKYRQKPQSILTNTDAAL